MTDIGVQKHAARKAAFARRKAAQSDELEATANEHLLAHLTPYFGSTVSGYMAMRTEINPMATMVRLSRHGTVAVPIVLGRGQPLKFHRWTESGEMQDGPFGARVPVDNEIVVPTVLIVPLAAYDTFGYRLGYGGGYYDRTLEILRAAGPVHAVGFAYSAQQVATLPTEPTDQRLDAIVTELGMQKF